MTAPDTSHSDRPHSDAVRHHRRRRARTVGLWSLGSTTVLGLLFAAGVLLLIGQTLSAPDWVRARIEARIEQSLGGFQITFGDVEMVINRGWRPRARLRDVMLSDAAGQPIVELANAEASLAMRPLLRGLVQPKSIELTGAFAVLRRDQSGAVSLTFGGSSDPVEQAPGLAQLVEQLDSVFDAPQFSALQTVDMNALTLQYEDARTGRAWTVDDGQMLLTRNGDQLRLSANLSLLTGRDYAASVELNYTSQIGETTAEFGVNLADVATQDFAEQSVALAWLDVLRAPVSGALRGSVDANGALGLLSATLQIGAGVLQPTDQTRPIPFKSARTYFTYAPDQQLLTFDEVSVDSSWVSATAEGQAYLGGLENGRLTDLIGQVQLSGISAKPGGLFTSPVELKAAGADFRLGLDPFDLKLGQLQITDKGSVVHVSGRLLAEEEGWNVAVDGSMNTLTPKRLIELWPEAAVPHTRTWLVDNLRGGRLSDVHFALRSTTNEAPDVYLDFDYADTEIRFMNTMPPITGASGQASLIGNRFVTTATKGQVVADLGGPVDISGTSFIIPDVSVRQAAPAVVRVAGQGSVTSILSLLNRDPLNILEKPGLAEDLAKGQVTFDGTLSLPLKARIDFSDVEFHVRGVARDVETSDLVPGHTLTSDNLDIRATDQVVSISGTGLIDDLPFEAGWTQPLGPGSGASRAEGTAELSPLTIQTFNIGLPPGTVSGSGRAGFALDLVPGVAPALTVTSDLRGVGLRIPELGWTKRTSGTGQLNVDMTLGGQPKVDRLSLNAVGLSATGSATIRSDGGLERASFSSVKLGGWLDARVDMIGGGPNVAPSLRILGGTLDLRRAEFGTGTGGTSAPAGPNALVASLDSLRITDTIALTGFQGRFAMSGGLNGTFQGRINGRTPVTGVVVPQDGRSAIRITAKDAGGVFRDSGLLKQARGGEFSMTLLPVGEAGDFDGTLRVTNTRILDAPAIAALLNAVSIVGLLNELAGQGIQFLEVNARFRLGPSRVTIYESSATGPSIGLSMDGLYDVVSQRLNMRGVISPVYLINGIGSILTRRGEGLIGFNYTLTGTAQSPSVSVNPLSALTPGMFRDLFRSEPPPVPPPVPPTTSSSSDPALAPPPEERREHPHADDR